MKKGIPDAPPCAVLVFAKAPVAGLAKTRLIPALGAEGAARLAGRMLEAAVAQARAAALGPVELCCAPDCAHPAFERTARAHGATLAPQGGGDLGERMSRALARTLALHGRALLTGTDAPALDAALLRSAARALDAHDAVFGPASDGGYTLVGLRVPAPALFEDMRWSTPQVMGETRRRLARLGLRHAELPVLPDVDEPPDLVHVPGDWLA